MPGPVAQQIQERCKVTCITPADAIKAIAHQEVLCTPVGFLHFHHRRDKISTLYHLCVSPSYRRQGVGKQLVEILEELAANNPIIGKISLFITLLFVIVEIVPLMAKLMSNYSPYDSPERDTLRVRPWCAQRGYANA